MKTDLRFLRVLPSKKNPKYWYWDRPGHTKEKLPAEPAVRAKKLTTLNAKADMMEEQAVTLAVTKETYDWDFGTVGWIAHAYQQSKAYKKLAPGTVKYYKRFLGEITADLGDLPFSAIDRAVVKGFIARYESESAPRQCAAVWRNLFNTAMDCEVVQDNRARDLRLPSPPKRDVVWEQDAIDRWMDVCMSHRKAEPMFLAFLLLMYTAQRPSDVLAMTRFQYDGEVIRLRQQKTQKLVGVPVHPTLKEALDSVLSADEGRIMLVDNGGKRMAYTRFLEAFNDIKHRANVGDLQPRDLRRTAMVRMAEAGATDIQISAVSGHTIEQTRQILETYVPRNVLMAKEGIAKLWYGKSKVSHMKQGSTER